MTPAFRAPSAIWGITLEPPGRPHVRSYVQLAAAQKLSAVAPPGPRLVRLLLLSDPMVRLAVALEVPGCGATHVVHTLRLMASPTRVEPGCLACRVWTEDSEESTVRYVEEWATEDAMRLRVRSERFTRLLEVLESAPAPPSVQFDFITETRGLDYVAEVRESDGMLETTLGQSGVTSTRP